MPGTPTPKAFSAIAHAGLLAVAHLGFFLPFVLPGRSLRRFLGRRGRNVAGVGSLPCPRASAHSLLLAPVARSLLGAPPAIVSVLYTAPLLLFHLATTILPALMLLPPHVPIIIHAFVGVVPTLSVVAVVVVAVVPVATVIVVEGPTITAATHTALPATVTAAAALVAPIVTPLASTSPAPSPHGH
jgi:hypothetical protein